LARAVNVEGTRNLLDAAARAKTARVLYCGSDTSLGDTAGQLRDEDKEHGGGDRSAYETTKREAHALVGERAAAGAPIVNAIVSTVYGPGDSSVIGEMIEHHVAGRLTFTLDRDAGYTFAHVDDVAAALKLAYEKGRAGERYLVSGTPASFGQFFAALSSVSGIPAPAIQVPGWLVNALMPLFTLLGALLGKSPRAIRELVAMGRGVTRFFSNDKARRELGWTPRELQAGLADTVPWYGAREREVATRALEHARPLLIFLALFDIALGVQASFFPSLYLAQLHPQFAALHGAGAPIYWLLRTGALWLFFAVVEAWSALAPARRCSVVLIVGALRLMDVPADLVYRFTADDLGWFGRWGLLVSPAFNFCVGVYLAMVGARGIRAGLASMRARP
jgi:dihydroflavonol-4-reductase